jgi:hypothetical protein
MERFLAARLGFGGGRIIRWPVHGSPGVRKDELIGGRDRRELVRNLRASLQPNLPTVCGIKMADGENPLVPKEAADRLAKLAALGTGIGEPQRTLLKAMNVRFLIARDSLPALGRPAFQDRVLAYELPDGGQPFRVEPEGAGEVLAFARQGPGRISLVAHFRRIGSIVVSESAVPGWRLDRPVPGCRLGRDGAGMLRVYLPAGRHDIRLRYDPVAVRAGLWAGMIMLSVLGGFAACGNFGRRWENEER